MFTDRRTNKLLMGFLHTIHIPGRVSKSLGWIIYHNDKGNQGSIPLSDVKDVTPIPEETYEALYKKD